MARRLAAIMFTDLAGFTTLTQRDEGAALGLAEELRALSQQVFSRHGGRVVKTMGDGALAEFPSALEAVRAAYDVQRAIRERNFAQDKDHQLQLRVGIHLGDVVESDGDIGGDAVNVASRLEPLARPGGICLSRQVYDQVVNKLDLELMPLGEVRLKNVERPEAVYRVVLPWDEKVPASPAVDRDRLAVLPLANFSPDPADEYLADGMTEELIGRLSGIRGLKVIARTSVMSYKRKDARLSQIAQELGVGSVVEGSVRRSGSRIRVAVQLIDARTEEHLWADQYDKELDDVFALQTDVAVNVARSLSQELGRTSAQGETSNVEAYTVYLKAMQLFHDGGESEVREALALFGRAVELDPGFGRAYAGLARAWALVAIFGGAPWTVIAEKAVPAAIRAVELSPQSAEAHAARAETFTMQDEFDSAIHEVEAAIRLNPNLSDAYETLGTLRLASGSLPESLSSYRRAYELDPVSVHRASEYAWMLQLMGADKEAFEVLERISRVRPEDPEVLDGFAEYYLLRNEWSDAARVLETGLRAHPHYTELMAERARLLALTGRPEEARNALREIQQLGNVVAYDMSQLYVLPALHELDGAFSALTRLTELHAWPPQITIHPLFAEMRKDPRYLDFRAKARLPG